MNAIFPVKRQIALHANFVSWNAIFVLIIYYCVVIALYYSIYNISSVKFQAHFSIILILLKYYNTRRKSFLQFCIFCWTDTTDLFSPIFEIFFVIIYCCFSGSGFFIFINKKNPFLNYSPWSVVNFLRLASNSSLLSFNVCKTVLIQMSCNKSYNWIDQWKTLL